MERLTEKDEFGNADIIGVDSMDLQCNLGFEEFNKVTDALNKLAEYEDLEEKGLPLRLPCRVGDTVYSYCSEFGILTYTVDCIVLDGKITYQCSSYSEPIGDCHSECLDEIEPDISDFGKTVFLTQDEAEEALERMEEMENE